MFYADSNHFIAFGKFVSIDLRVKVRDLVTARCVETFVVSTKVANYEILTDWELPSGNLPLKRQGFKDAVVYDRLKSMIHDLANLVIDKGWEALYDHLYTLCLNAEEQVRVEESTSGAFMYLIGELWAMNNVTPTFSRNESWVKTTTPPVKDADSSGK
jgi:hypothetical protein